MGTVGEESFFEKKPPAAGLLLGDVCANRFPEDNACSMRRLVFPRTPPRKKLFEKGIEKKHDLCHYRSCFFVLIEDTEDGRLCPFSFSIMRTNCPCFTLCFCSLLVVGLNLFLSSHTYPSPRSQSAFAHIPPL